MWIMDLCAPVSPSCACLPSAFFWNLTMLRISSFQSNDPPSLGFFLCHHVSNLCWNSMSLRLSLLSFLAALRRLTYVCLSLCLDGDHDVSYKIRRKSTHQIHQPCCNRPPWMRSLPVLWFWRCVVFARPCDGPLAASKWNVPFNIETHRHANDNASSQL